MNSDRDKSRDAIAADASAWFVANNEGPLDARDSAALATWLRASPVHIEEFLAVAALTSDLRQVRTQPEYSVAAILARARAEVDEPVESLWPNVHVSERRRSAGRWLLPAATLAACALLAVGVFVKWSHGTGRHAAAPEFIATLNFRTQHGEQLTQRLADNTVLHLNTDSAVSIRYSSNERLVVLESGQATFEVVHEAKRGFRVQAGSAEVIDLGTKFDVRRDRDTTIVTVVEGRVAVAPAKASQAPLLGSIELNADQQLRVVGETWPATPVAVDAKSVTAWLHREIAFENEPLEQVVAEYNRYTVKPIEIVTPALRSLRISGVFATDDTDAFVAFLRSLEGVRVEVTATKILVMRR